MPRGYLPKVAARPTRSTTMRPPNSARKTGVSKSSCTGRVDAMNAVLAFLVSRWSVSFIGTALLAAILWFFGPFLAWLEPWGTRLMLIVLMFAVWAGTNLLLDWR